MKPGRIFTRIVFLSFLLIAINYSFAQSNKSKCPTVRVNGPAEVSVGDRLSFTADVQGGDAQITPTYNWSISAGTISSGQGTSSITVEITDAESGQSVTATVDVGGYSRECSTSSSYTTSIMKKNVAKKVIEYRNIKLGDEKAMLDFFANELQMDPIAIGYIITYAGIKSKPNTAKIVGDRAKKYLVSMRGIADDRIILIDGGYRQEQITELYLIPYGAVAPNAEPTVDPSLKKTPTPVKTTPAKTKVKVK